MKKRLIKTIVFLSILLFLGIYFIVLKPIPFPSIQGMGEIDKDAASRYTTTKSGLQYRVLRKGKDSKPARLDEVIVLQKGWLSNGYVVFDSFETKKPQGVHGTEYTLPGIAEGVLFVGEGGLIEMILTPELSYGKRGHSGAKTPNNSSMRVVLKVEKIIRKYFSKNPEKIDDDAPEEYTKTASGLQYKILRKSDGVKPKEGDFMIVHYTGAYDGENIFKDTYKVGIAGEMVFNTQVKGVQEGMKLIGVGGVIDLLIPPELGYGEKSMGKIPANSTLHYIIDLKEIRKK